MTTAQYRQLQLVKREVPAADSVIPSRVREFVASDDTVDSYNTRIFAEGIKLDRYKRNSVVLLHHNMRSFPIGKGEARLENGQLICAVDFAPSDDPISGPEAEQALRWIDRGVMAMSIGFDVLEAKYVEERETGDPWRDLFYPPEDYTSTELFETSIVSVPANPNALPVGRTAAAQARFLQRIAPSTPPAIVPPTPAAIAAVAGVPQEDFRSMVERITREEKQAQAARRSGKTSRS